MTVDQQLIDAAAAALNVTVVEALKEGGQKTVLLTERTGERFVMKVIATGSTLPDAFMMRTRTSGSILRLTRSRCQTWATSVTTTIGVYGQRQGGYLTPRATNATTFSASLRLRTPYKHVILDRRSCCTPHRATRASRATSQQRSRTNCG
jgi:hypothetical protein